MYTHTSLSPNVQQESMLPYLVIGGAPKCGTSSLYNWLNDHPEMWGSQPKETFFLMDAHSLLINKSQNYHKDGLEGYAHFFKHNAQNPGIPFEATTHYLYQDTALEVLSAIDPRPHMIFLLRKPSKRILSSFEFTRNNLAGFSTNLSFAEYTQLLLNGKAQELETFIHRKNSLHVLRQDLYYSTYILFLEKWKQAMGTERIHIYLFEEMARSPRKVMCDIARRIGIDASFYHHYAFAKKNSTYGVKSKSLHQFVKSFSSGLPSGNVKRYLKNIYLALQSQKIGSTQEDQEALLLLDQYFEPYNKALAKTFHLNLDVWQ